MGESCMSRAIFLSWILWINFTVLEASSTEKFGSNVEESEIMKLCNVTGPDYLFCMNCLNGPDHPTRTRKHRPGNDDMEMLGAKTIRCAHNSALMAGNVMNDYSKNSTGDIQAAAVFCIPEIEKSSESFNEALGLWSDKEKDQALEKIKFGRDSYYECARKVPPESPSSLFHVLNSVRSLGEVAEFVIRSINV